MQNQVIILCEYISRIGTFIYIMLHILNYLTLVNFPQTQKHVQ